MSEDEFGSEDEQQLRELDFEGAMDEPEPAPAATFSGARRDPPANRKDMETMAKEETEQLPAAEAETVTQKPVEEPPSQPADRLAELEQTITQGFGKIAKVLAAQQEQINELMASPEPENGTLAESPRPQGLAEGVVRFHSRYKDLGVWMKPAARTIIDGKLHVDPGRFLEFTNGIFDTNDEAEIDFLRSHKGDGSASAPITSRTRSPSRTPARK
jgi:hypothetical protein